MVREHLVLADVFNKLLKKCNFLVRFLCTCPGFGELLIMVINQYLPLNKWDDPASKIISELSLKIPPEKCGDVSGLFCF